MPELRKDPIHGRWVIISTERSRRPSDFVPEERRPIGGFCPLCEGNEDRTPPEIVAFRDNGTFGICDSCGRSISEKRLIARPVTTLCIECKTEGENQERMERQRGTRYKRSFPS